MQSPSVEVPSPPQHREFKIGSTEEVKVQQAGRVFKLSHADRGSIFFIDVTDRIDHSNIDSDDVASKGIIIRDHFKEDLEGPEHNDEYSVNQFLAGLITDKLDLENRKRIYLGFPEIEIPEVEKIPKLPFYDLLEEAGFKRDSFYIPFTSQLGGTEEDIERTRQWVLKEIEDAKTEIPLGQDMLKGINLAFPQVV